jgi:phosphoribosylpyrophosphate synthetase
VQALQPDISEANSQYVHAENQICREIDDIRKQMKNNNSIMVSPNASDFQRADRLRDNGQLQSKITDMEHELSRLKIQTDQRIRDVQQRIDSLNYQAANLEKLFPTLT